MLAHGGKNGHAKVTGWLNFPTAAEMAAVKSDQLVEPEQRRLWPLLPPPQSAVPAPTTGGDGEDEDEQDEAEELAREPARVTGRGGSSGSGRPSFKVGNALPWPRWSHDFHWHRTESALVASHRRKYARTAARR